LRSAVRDDTFWEAVEFLDIIEEELGCSLCCDCCVRWNEVYSFGDSIMSRGLQEFNHEIDTEGILPCVQNRERLKLANRRMSPRFRLEAKIASTHILADVPRHMGPPVVPGY